MKYVISEKFGTVYSRGEDGFTRFHPLSQDGTFNTEEGGEVETWEDMDVMETARVIALLNS